MGCCTSTPGSGNDGEPSVSTTSNVTNEVLKSGATSATDTLETVSEEDYMQYGSVETAMLVAQLSRDSDAQDEAQLKLSFLVESACNIKVHRKETQKHHAGKDGWLFRLTIMDKTGTVRYPSVESEAVFDPNGNPYFNLQVVLSNLIDSDVLKFSLLKSYFGSTTKKKLGRTIMGVSEFRTKKSWPELWIFTKTGIAVFDKHLRHPSTLRIVQIECEELCPPSSMSTVPLVESSENQEAQPQVDVKPGGEDRVAVEGPPKLKRELTIIHSCRITTHTSEENRSESPKTPQSDVCQPFFGDNEDEEGEDEVEVELESTASSAVSMSPPASPPTSPTPLDQRKRKHILVVTRGTRGDVQPFIALARGLAQEGWKVTICTELRYKPLVHRYAEKFETGSEITYAPSGGDTETRIEKPIAKWAVHTKMEWLHAIMLARTEREFFDSEPAFFYWAKRLKPDYLLYTFVTANLTMIISEALKIPMIGFFLQPTVLPSKQYPALAPINMDSLTQHEEELERKVGHESHRTFKFIKRMMENNMFTRRINEMRKRRGLEPTNRHVNDFDMITKRGFPLVVPIKPEIFGGYPKDWPKSTRMTELIFLRSGLTPPLGSDIEGFIATAKANKNPIIAICFSSMPVSRVKILESALLILEKCPAPYKPAIIALIGNRPPDESTNADQEKRADSFVEEKRLLVLRGAPFSKLFPLMDFIVLHGGLGTTGEALAAGVPCMVTGVLLFDQRFWGKRIYDLGVGPPPCHITDFNSKILDILPSVLDPQGAYSLKAKEVANEIFPGGAECMGDGVKENVDAILECSELAFAAPGN